MNDMVNHPRHYNSHPSGVECIEICEHMTFNLGNAFKYLWRSGLKADDPREDLEKALWYLRRSDANDRHYLTSGPAAHNFRATMAERLHVFNRPSPWCEPVRRALAYICDLHSGRDIRDRCEISRKAMQCVETALADCDCMGRGLEP